MKLSAALIGSTMAVDRPQPSTGLVNAPEPEGTKKPFKNIHVKDDMFYSPAHLNHLEKQVWKLNLLDLFKWDVKGIDTSDFSGAVDHGARLSGRGLEGGAREWYQTDADGYLVVPYSHTANYPEPEKLVAGMDGMTNDLMPCMRMEYVPRDQLRNGFWKKWKFTIFTILSHPFQNLLKLNSIRTWYLVWLLPRKLLVMGWSCSRSWWTMEWCFLCHECRGSVYMADDWHGWWMWRKNCWNNPSWSFARTRIWSWA